MLEGKIRESISKANAKALRKDGNLIANIYGKGIENIHCYFKENDFIKFMRSKNSIKFPVKVDGKELLVVAKSYNIHPVRGSILHVDLMVAQDGVVANFSVPVKTVGTPIGLKNKGILLVSHKRVPVKCDAKHLPDSYTIDVSKLDVGHSVLVRDLNKHDNVEIKLGSSVAIVGVIKAK
ncbi:50S ribosomal protein L25/general stress protein Ctc [Helicobacter sp. 13S00401-1]|uniref:50S ribosomal protein L25/general stress protein Ctc n=1 Tax=Helicobacter sp. 13S00401-1 TaxID=1905758 RepID=UPI000BA59E06|nr:50S ribosomal protein L25/general stress protein Ctc [Helicobacter sp. 13S00401-1]PAF51456.1 50S ribosomal protein L25/general stress protein Ctc [Helicobacter sp. 13S00401-1]